VETFPERNAYIGSFDTLGGLIRPTHKPKRNQLNSRRILPLPSLKLYRCRSRREHIASVMHTCRVPRGIYLHSASINIPRISFKATKLLVALDRVRSGGGVRKAKSKPKKAPTRLCVSLSLMRNDGHVLSLVRRTAAEVGNQIYLIRAPQ